MSQCPLSAKRFCAVLLLSMSLSSFAFAAPKALIYKGEGSCEEECSEALQNVATLAGFEPVYVAPGEKDPKIFDGAAIWMQPGGYAANEVNAMSPQLKDNLRAFIKNGGGYIGFCAGAYAATARVGTTRYSGLGIFPGNTSTTRVRTGIQKFNFAGSDRYLYFEGGPYITNLPASVEVMAHFPDGHIAAARTTYGKGRVYIASMHPEAPADWRENPHFDDPDGLDWDLAVGMAQWVTEAHAK
jgi:glutamine amidotransferase-like uncharacterized protein